LAVAALGETWFGDAGFDDFAQGDYRTTLEHLRTLPARATEADTWWNEAAVQGERIGRRFRSLAGKLDQLANEESGISKFDAFGTRLAEADRLARMVVRGDEPPEAKDVEPSSRYRQARVHEFLLWMAERAWRDHWYDEKPAAPPYYRTIVGRLFDDAEGLFPALREGDQKQRAKLLAEGRLAIDGPDQLVVTSEREASAAYRAIDEPGAQREAVPDGIPVVRPKVTDPLVLAKRSTADYRVLPRGSEAPTEVWLKSPTSDSAERREPAAFAELLAKRADRLTRLDAEGFFRGQIFKLSTTVDLDVVPDAIAIGPAPPDPARASVAVRASEEVIRTFGEGTGAIAMVLDCSGSMNDPARDSDGPTTKISAAKKALRAVLKESVIPQGTKLSIWTFSQLFPDIMIVDGKYAPGTTPEQIQRMEQANVEPERTISCLRSLASWDPGQLEKTSALFEGIKPYFETPLVEAMWRAADDLKNASGLKNLLVLTDGNDTQFFKSRALNPEGKISIPSFITDKFRGLGIRVTVVYFKASGLAEADAKKEAQEVLDAKANFERPLEGLVPPGRFVEARDLKELIESLRAGLEQRLVCHVIRADRRPAGSEPLLVTRPKGDLPFWWAAGLDPGFYTLRVVAGRSYEQGINLMEGDRLSVELVDNGSGGIAFRRAIYGDEDDFRAQAKPPVPDWRLAFSPSQKTRDKPAGWVLMAAIESNSTSGTMLEQVRPAWADFRVTVDGLSEPTSAIALRWRERMTYPAPIWQLDVSSWPADPTDTGRLAPPSLTAWWRGPGVLPHDAEFSLDRAATAFDVKVSDNRVVHVESYRLENDHYVEIKPGQPPEPKNCLVIRLAYPKDSPYFIDPASLAAIQTTGYEHRFYSQAQKYAGLFWRVNPDQLEDLRRSKLRLVSVNRLRQEAAKRKQMIQVKLERPRDDVKLPEPPDAIRN
jgi:hypothetical protein